jgi:hypothetical protein
MENLTREELREAQRTYIDDLTLPVIVDGVTFYKTSFGTLGFRFGNSRGLIHPDNGYRGCMEDNKDYYLLWRLSCSHNTECKYNPTFTPGLTNAASAIRKSWERFCSGN